MRQPGTIHRRAGDDARGSGERERERERGESYLRKEQIFQGVSPPVESNLSASHLLVVYARVREARTCERSRRGTEITSLRPKSEAQEKLRRATGATTSLERDSAVAERRRYIVVGGIYFVVRWRFGRNMNDMMGWRREASGWCTRLVWEGW